MQIIMLQDVDKVGYKHDVVTVKDGFGRNYLIPNGLAIIANKSNLGRLAEMTRREDAQEQKRLDEYKEIAKAVNGKTLEILAKAGTSGKIFGSITPLMVHTALESQYNVDIPRKKIVMPEGAKVLGEYELVLNLHKEVSATMNMNLTDESGKTTVREEEAPATSEEE
ncbi:50S ribosomal protein L9 [Lewinellaceae bacterium SD302]|nr:50S ribosomal protein L9 [Lewinellaceae bacterium SD302]